MGGDMQAPTGGSYTNSGLWRFGNVPMYQPTPYTPTLFAAPQLAPARPMVNRGLLAPAPDYVDRTSGGSSGAVGDPSTNAVSDTATVGSLGGLASVGLAGIVGGFPGAIGQAISIGQNNANANAAVGSISQPGIADAIAAAMDDGSAGIGSSVGDSGIGVGSVGAGATGEGDGGAGEGGGGGAGGGGK